MHEFTCLRSILVFMQIEGAAREAGKGASIWDIFSHQPGKILGNKTGDIAVDHYHRYAV